MPRKFNVPPFYRSQLIAKIKQARGVIDPRKKDFSPSLLDFGPVKFKIARHFGFCFGVENAIEIAYRAIEENQGKRIFLLSEMIHNPQVNNDLQERGVKFLMRTDGSPIVPFDTLSKEDIVIVPAFGTTVEIQDALDKKGIDPYFYDTTCPFVEKVWKRSGELGKQGHSVIVHGKRTHEETRATFSHSKETSPTIIVLDKAEAEIICQFIRNEISSDQLREHLGQGMSAGFDPEKHLQKVGVVNQTTMLATETREIAEMIRKAMVKAHGESNISKHFADTRDTLCYATSENQTATMNLIESGADIAIVVGGYNSSNTSHLFELCEEKIPTYYVKNEAEIDSVKTIRHFLPTKKQVIESENWVPDKRPITVALTSGASCPDRTVDLVMLKVAKLLDSTLEPEIVLEDFGKRLSQTSETTLEARVG